MTHNPDATLYRIRPAVVEARRVDGDDPATCMQIADWADAQVVPAEERQAHPDLPVMWLPTVADGDSEDLTPIEHGDWIVRHAGGFFCVLDEAFHIQFEPAVEL